MISDNVSAKSRSTFLYRDLIVWLFFLLILPLVLYSVYFFAKQDKIQLTYQLDPLSPDKLVEGDDTNYLNIDDLVKPNPQQFEEFSDYSRSDDMKRISLQTYSNALCNDGSPASYYLRKTKSKTWIILLEGGYFCYDTLTCQQRLHNSPQLTSSINYESFKRGAGILSSSKIANKYWSNANVVQIPYCSSDLWIGNSMRCKQNCTDKLNFLGQQILDNVFTDLLNVHSMKGSNQVLLTGISAGGLGVLFNANQLKQKLNVASPGTDMKAIIDSSWLFDLPYSYLCNYLDAQDECFINKMFTQSLKFWNAHLPSECTRDARHVWDCFLPSNLISSLQMPVFIIQSMFDETQLLEQSKQFTTASRNVHLTKSSELFRRTLQVVNEKLIGSVLALDAPHGHFITSCTHHMILQRDDWSRFKIDNVLLEEALQCWINTSRNNKRCKSKTEQCAWPNCHDTCPAIQHPERVNVSVSPLEYFSYFGLVNYEDLANEFNVSLNYLKEHSHYTSIMRTIVQDSASLLL